MKKTQTCRPQSRRTAGAVGLLLFLAVVFAAPCPFVRSSIAAAAPSPMADAGDYRIAPDDTLNITVLGESDLTQQVSVLPDGSISYPYLGDAVVAGETLEQVRQRVAAALSREIVNPQVTVSLQTQHVSEVSVLGDVKSPGKLPMKSGWRVIDAIAGAGGLTAQRPEWASAMLIRAGSQTIPLDLKAIMGANDSDKDLALQPGDVILVQQLDPSQTEVQVLGEVAHPGFWPDPPDGSIVSVLSAAGGATADAALSRASVLRAGVSISVDLTPVLTNGEIMGAPTLQAGDTLVIPRNKAWFAVYGAVQKPGYESYPDSSPVTVLSALSEAGGETGTADLKHASIVSVGADGKSTVTHLDLQALISRGDMTQNPVVPEGSVLYVPDKGSKPKFDVTDLFSISALITALR